MYRSHTLYESYMLLVIFCSDTEPVKYKESYSRLVILYNNTHAHTHKSTLTKCIL
jgi:hypothetical protein